LEGIALNLTDNSKTQDNYFEVKVSDKIATYGGCAAWQRYTSGDLAYSSLFQVPSALKIVVSSSYFSDKLDTISCTDRSVAASILDRIVTPAAGGLTSSFTCQDHVWRVKDCASTGYSSFCVDCTDPCAKDFCTPTDPFYIGPCGTSGTSCSFPSAYIRIFTAEFLDTRDVYPTVSSFAKTVSRTAAKLKLSLSGEGVVSCAVFAQGVAPTSSAQILLQKNTATAIDKEVNFNITGLIPSTAYDVYCYSTSTSGAAMTLADVLSTKIPIVTDCCRELTLTVGIGFLYQDEQSLNTITLSSDAAVPSEVSVMLQARSATGNLTDLQPPIVKFQNALSVKASVAAVNTAVRGTVTIVGTVLNSTAYSVVFAQGRNTFTVLAKAARVPPPSLVSAAFSSSGTGIIFTFDSPTDQGGRTSASAFACSTLFIVVDSAAPTCQWQSTSALVMTPAPKSTLVPGSEIVLLGNTLKSPCALAKIVCQSWDYTSAKRVVVSAPVDAILPAGKNTG
jgi:hypothetical protein